MSTATVGNVHEIANLSFCLQVLRDRCLEVFECCRRSLVVVKEGVHVRSYDEDHALRDPAEQRVQPNVDRIPPRERVSVELVEVDHQQIQRPVGQKQLPENHGGI